MRTNQKNLAKLAELGKKNWRIQNKNPELREHIPKKKPCSIHEKKLELTNLADISNTHRTSKNLIELKKKLAELRKVCLFPKHNKTFPEFKKPCRR